MAIGAASSGQCGVNQSPNGAAAQLWPRTPEVLLFQFVVCLEIGRSGDKQGIVEEEGSCLAAPAGVRVAELLLLQSCGCDVALLRKEKVCSS